MLAETLINRVRDQLHDNQDVRWALEEKVRALNIAQKMVVVAKPDANTVTVALELAVGTTRQRLPARGFKFLRLTRNLGVDGTTTGRVITFVDYDAMNLENIGWHTDTAAAVIQHFMYDNTDPLTFWVYPAAHATTKVFVELVHSAEPTEIDEAAYNSALDVIGLPDIYEAALFDFMLSRLFLKNEEASDQAAAQLHAQLAYQSLGVKTQKDNLFNPQIRTGEHEDNRPRPEATGV